MQHICLSLWNWSFNTASNSLRVASTSSLKVEHKRSDMCPYYLERTLKTSKETKNLCDAHFTTAFSIELRRTNCEFQYAKKQKEDLNISQI